MLAMLSLRVSKGKMSSISCCCRCCWATANAVVAVVVVAAAAAAAAVTTFLKAKTDEQLVEMELV